MCHAHYAGAMPTTEGPLTVLRQIVPGTSVIARVEVGQAVVQLVVLPASDSDHLWNDDLVLCSAHRYKFIVSALHGVFWIEHDLYIVPSSVYDRYTV